MDPFTAMAIAATTYSAFNSIFGSQPDRPQSPSLIPPSPEPAREFADFTDWQNAERSRLLAEYWGGTVRDNPMDLSIGAYTGPPFVTLSKTAKTVVPGRADGSPGGTPTEEGHVNLPAGVNIDAYHREMPTTRLETSFTGNLPAQKYFNAQQGITKESREGFSSDVGKYLKERGFAPGEADVSQQGATEEMRKSYKQRDLDIKSRAEDIRAQTLATLFGEVSDAGPQAQALAANLGNANQMFNQSMINSYNAAMQQYAYNQSAPMDPLAASMGQMLPILAMMYGGGMGGGGVVPQTYPAGYGVDPRVSGLTYPMQF